MSKMRKQELEIRKLRRDRMQRIRLEKKLSKQVDKFIAKILKERARSKNEL